MSEGTARGPRETLSLLDGSAIIIGMVIGVGIFATPSLVAQMAGDGPTYLLLWLLGGVLALVGALCYAELATRFPNAGGEYAFLSRAYGRQVGVLFAWARGSVIQTGAIALVAFVYGDYAQTIAPLGAYGPAMHAAIIIVVFTAINMAGTAFGKGTQQIFTTIDIAALAMVIAAALVFTANGGAPALAGEAPPVPRYDTLGLAMVFVLLTFGGWNEAAYISAELRDGRRNMVRVLTLSIVIVTAIYLMAAWSYLHVMGLSGVQKSNAIATDVTRVVFGAQGAVVMSALVCGAAVSTLNATIFTGARVYYALGRDLSGLKFFGIWSGQGENPRNAFLLQGAIALALVAWGAVSRDGFRTMVEYTSPVFWLFMTLTGVSLFVFRRRAPERGAYFRVPLYPLTPLVFIGMCLWMLYSSLVYTGAGALVGFAVLLLGLPLVFLSRAREQASGPAEIAQ